MSSRLPLKLGYILKGYTISQVLGGGGFSLVYLASSELDRKPVVIKEYCPQDLVARQPDGTITPNAPLAQTPFRQGLDQFLQEATALTKIQHPNVLSVTDCFHANSTAYMVMNHEAGRDLRWFLKQLAGSLDWDFLQQIFPKIGDGLWRMHQLGVIHLDVKPANILLRTSGEPLLLDFGAAKTIGDPDRFSSFQTVTHGFAPPEQYLDGDLGPWTDIYALAATMYNCITGAPPPPALKRKEGTSLGQLTVNYTGKYPYTLLKTVESSLAMDRHQRPADLGTFLALAFGQQATSANPGAEPALTGAAQP